MKKIKARDIVAGWPRGTSSSKGKLADTQRFMLAMRMELAGWIFASSYVQLVSAELGEKLLYEMSQREMTDDFRRRLSMSPREELRLNLWGPRP